MSRNLMMARREADAAREEERTESKAGGERGSAGNERTRSERANES